MLISYWHHLDRVRGVLPAQGFPVGLLILVVLDLVLVGVGLWYCGWIFTESTGSCGMAATEALRLNARRRAWNFMTTSFTHAGHLYSAQFSLGHE